MPVVAVTLNEKFEARVRLPRLGVFKRGIQRTVTASDQMVDQFERSSMWTIKTVEAPTAKAMPATRIPGPDDASGDKKSAKKRVKNG